MSWWNALYAAGGAGLGSLVTVWLLYWRRRRDGILIPDSRLRPLLSEPGYDKQLWPLIERALMNWVRRNQPQRPPSV